jgi:DNA polymerase alpha-associated DNA helicase A
VLQCARVSDVPKNSDLSMHTAACARLKHCQHSLLISVVCGIQEEDSEFVQDLRKYCRDFSELSRRGAYTDDDMQPIWCSVRPLYSAIALVRCIRAARSICENSNVWPLISSNPSRKTTLRDTQRRVPISSSNVSSRSIIIASYDLVVAACQIWRTFGEINMGQWMVMHHTVNCLRNRQQEIESPIILLEGPPGTGKTSTISKLLSLLYHQIPAYEAPSRNTRKRIPAMRTLICTASNSGLDEILNRFVKEGVSTINFEPVTGASKAQGSVIFTEWFKTVHDKAANRELDCDSLIGSRSIRASQSHVVSLEDEEESDIRVVRLGRTDNSVAQSFSCMHERSANLEEDIDTDIITRSSAQHSALVSITEADIVFTTLATCGSEHLRNIGNFDFILIDEAGQAMEPEALIPLAKHFGPKTALLVVGDTQQLGPTVKSQAHLVQSILGTSFLQRMLKSRPDKIVSLRLNIQYRMHADIALFISRRYYGGGLSSHPTTRRAKKLLLLGAPMSAVCIDTSSFCESAETRLQVSRNRRLFHEANDGTSFTNSGEAMLVNKILHTLLCENKVLKATEIAVITPYTAQTRLIRQRLGEMSPAMTTLVDIDTIDAFQGSERSVVIIDLVRSEGTTIGFIGDERRSNVAISRAKDLLIVVGNMTTMKSKRPNPWVDWMEHCENLDAFSVVKDEDRLSKMWSLPLS